MKPIEGGLHGAHLRSDVIEQIGPHALRVALRDRVLITSWPRVVVEAACRDQLLTRGAAALLAYGPNCALSGPTAAELHGCGAAATPRTHVTLPFGKHPRPRFGLVVHGSAGFERDAETVCGLRVLSLDRVVADMLCRARPRDALAVCDQALALQDVVERERWRSRIRERIAARPDIRGTRRGAELLDMASGRAESPPESWLLLTVVELGFPLPEANWPLYSPRGEIVYRLDLAWPALRIAVEHQGYAVHAGRDREDEARFEDLERRGWIVVTAQASDLRDHHDFAVRLRAAFARRGYDWLPRSA
jgi:hypothetical protein